MPTNVSGFVPTNDRLRDGRNRLGLKICGVVSHNFTNEWTVRSEERLPESYCFQERCRKALKERGQDHGIQLAKE